MAEEKQGEGPIVKGAVLPVTIEDVLADVLVVFLQHGAKMYKGILLDSTKRDMPYGVGFDRFRLEAEKASLTEAQTAYVDPNVGEGSGGLNGGCAPAKPQVTALSCRYTYIQDPKSTDPSLLPPPRTTLVKPIRDGKNVRSMRLRPRKVLCSNCKQGIHDNKVEGSTTSVDSTTTQPSQGQGQQNGRTANLTNPSTRPTLRMSLRGKRGVGPPPAAMPSPKRPRRQCFLSNANRTSPVIKISFTSPQGEVHTSKLSTSSLLAVDTAEENDQETDPQYDENGELSYDYKRLKKALKKAKLREKTSWEEEGAEVTTTVPDENGIRHHKKSKRNKHKRKHRHRDPSSRSPQQEMGSGGHNNNSSDFENDSGSRDKEGEEEIKVKNWGDWDEHQYGVYDSSQPKEGSHFKENSINVPRPPPPPPSLTPSRPSLPPDPPQPDDQAAVLASSRSPYPNSSVHSYGASPKGSGSPHSAFDTDEDGDMPPAGDEFPTNEESEEQEEARLRPLMMRIQTRNVSSGALPDGRNVSVGDVVWGKIHGFPWWPGKILTITLSQRENGTVITQMAHIAWCGSSTTSHIPCSELYPFLEDFKTRYNKKKKGPYKNAIKEAMRIAHGMLNAQTRVADDVVDADDATSRPVDAAHLPTDAAVTGEA